MSSTAPQCTHSTVRIFSNNVLPCPVVRLQNSRTAHGMNQPPFRSPLVRTATQPNSTHRLAHPNHNSPLSPFLIGSSAIRNARKCPAITAKSISNRSKNACLCSRFSHISRTTHQQPHRTSNASLIATQILEIHLTRSQQTRKLFLIATFSGCLTKHCSPITLHQPVP
jgi:hypothetical protein